MATKKKVSGHAINLSSFNTVIKICTSFDDKYNPGNPDIMLTVMTGLWNSGEDGQKTLIEAVAATKVPISERELLYKGLSPLVTRVIGAVKSSKASDKMKADLKSKADAIRGYRRPKKKEEEKKNGEEATEKSADEQLVTISQSQMSYVQRAKSFFEFIEMLKTVKEYKVNEADLKTDSLEAVYTQMKGMNDGMGTIINTAKMGLIKRDRILYAAGTGIIDIVRACKNYVKGVFGADSAELKLLTKLPFRDLQKKVREELNAVS